MIRKKEGLQLLLQTGGGQRLTDWAAQPPSPDRKRKANICPGVFAKPQAVLKTKKKTLLPCSTIIRPYISLSGLVTIGPKEKASM